MPVSKRRSYAIASRYSSTNAPDNLAHAQERLEAEGLSGSYEIVIADDMHLQLDYDDCNSPDNTFYSGLSLLRKRIGEDPRFVITESRSGNCHVIITLPEPMQLLERIAWQALLGSDPVREGISLINTARGQKHPVLLFERKAELGK